MKFCRAWGWGITALTLRCFLLFLAVMIGPGRSAFARADSLTYLKQAIGVLEESKKYEAIEGRPEVTLSRQREAIHEPPAQRALMLLRQAMTTPLPPAEDPYGLPPGKDAAVRFVRLLRVVETVELADGHTTAALLTLEEGLRVGDWVKPLGIFGFLTGYATDGEMLEPISRHLDQLSARDCDLLLRQMRRRFSCPDPLPEAIAYEAMRQQRIARQVIEETVEPDASDADLASLIPDNPEDLLEIQALRTDPAKRVRFIAEVENRLSQMYSAAAAEYRRTGAISSPSLPSPQTVAERVADRRFAPSPGILPVFGDRALQDRTWLRLLAVHAALRQYRWQQNRYPERLEELDLGDGITDPTTGAPLRYFHQTEDGEDSYWLESAGVPRRDETGKVIQQHSKPLTLPIRAVRPSFLSQRLAP